MRLAFVFYSLLGTHYFFRQVWRQQSFASATAPQEACGLGDDDAAANPDNRIRAGLPPILRGKSATADGLLPSPIIFCVGF
jgi:hypothetical protein